MSYILKRCGPPWWFQSFVQQRIFNGASHEQEPYGPKQEEKTERSRKRSVGRVWWNGEMVVGGGKRKKRGEGGAGERLWLIAFCVVLQWFVLQNHWVPGGEMTRQAQTVHHWHFQTMGGSWNEDDIKYFPLFSQESEQIVATWGLVLSGYMSTHSQTKAGKMRWSPVQGFMSHKLLS